MTGAQHSLSVVEPPMVVQDAADLDWQEEADLVVVGFGAAGAATALQGRESGADVLVLDQFEGGGVTFYSGGVVYAGGTSYQRAAGIEDDLGEMQKYLVLEADDCVRPETLARYCRDSAGNIDWLAGHGVGFAGIYQPGKMILPDDEYALYHSGNELVPAFAAVARPAPRGHKPLGKGPSGHRLFSAMKAAAMKIGVRTRWHCRVMRLVVDHVGRVVGVEAVQVNPAAARSHQKIYRMVKPLLPFNTKRSLKAIERAKAIEAERSTRILIRARGGVVLACGGFNYNEHLLRQHNPAVHRNFDKIMILGAAGCSGAGIEMGLSVGGATGYMGNACFVRMIAPPSAALAGMLVNADGKRFVNEDTYVGRVGVAILEQPRTKAWLVVDKAIFWRIVRQCRPEFSSNYLNFCLPLLLNIAFGGTRKGRTLADLEAKCGMPAGSLQQTVRTSNEAIAANRPDPFGKNGDYVERFEAGPYRAINFSIDNRLAFFPFFTIGGLRVNEDDGAVVRADNTPISGLYAAGRTAVGISSNRYFSGMSLADCIFSGRRAANAITVARANSAMDNRAVECLES